MYVGQRIGIQAGMHNRTQMEERTLQTTLDENQSIFDMCIRNISFMLNVSPDEAKRIYMYILNTYIVYNSKIRFPDICNAIMEYFRLGYFDYSKYREFLNRFR